MKALRILGAGAVMALAIPVLASAGGFLDSNFDGSAISSVSDAAKVYTVGEDYTVYVRLHEDAPSAGDPWYPWDLPAKEYTAEITTVVDAYSTAGGFWFATFGTSTMRIYEDPSKDADPGDGSNPLDAASFTNGTMILEASSDDFNAWGDLSNDFWNPNGHFYFTGGPGLGNLYCDEAQWLRMADFADVASTVPPNMDENYDAKWDCQGTVVSVEDEAWGSVKSRYR